MPHHPPCRIWLEDALSGEERIALPWQVAVAVLPTPISAASLA